MARGPRYAIPAPTPARLSDGPFLVTTHQMHFVIPTYRLRDVGETVEAYDDNFARCGQSAPITVFDDSSIANHQKYYDTLEATRTQNEVWYVGPAEKEQFLGYICRRLKDRKLDMLVRNLFRPSYGGNRNFTLMYTLGDLMVSADDDMRPYALIEDSPEALAENEVSRGKLIPRGANGHSRKSYDILASFRDILGRTVADAPANYDQGELLVDSAMDLETNNSLGFCRDNALTLQPGTLPRGGIIKMAQTFRTGTNDIDAVDYVDMFLDDPDEVDAERLNDTYVMVNFRPCLTNVNWRMDCGVAGYDNTTGLPPFFPTRLRFEDYIYRLWIQQSGFVAAHVDSAQTHIKNSYMRNPWPPKCSTRRSAGCSSASSAPLCARPMNGASVSTMTAMSRWRTASRSWRMRAACTPASSPPWITRAMTNAAWRWASSPRGFHAPSMISNPISSSRTSAASSTMRSA
jgi:hypothetical protein